ncbi:hydantoinase B/oxoprolinase family protein [Streptomyces sp. SID8352]|nr:hydantoinase B/oxoprolinase family protein [Streptomyces sp. SID8352]
MHSLLNEQQVALIRVAFSPVVRESLDLACAVFDSAGRMIGQSSGGTPGHINAMATGMEHIVAAFPQDTLAEGDVLITNDPWLTAGQINDITVATPVYRGGTLVAWFASCCHSPDIGGRILSAAATEVFEEGLRLPVMRLRSAAGPDETLEQIIRANVRTPDETLGDIYAQVAANEVGARSLLAMMDEFGLHTIDPVADEIMRRSEAALRTALSELQDGVYCAEATSDGFDGEAIHLKARVTIRGDAIDIDYDGSSPQSRNGVNVVLNYTRAYTSFAVKAAFAPEVPHNAGSFRPVTVRAPAGSVLNCVDPAPVASRHLVGHFLPSLLFEALRPAVPGGLQASSADALWMTVWRSAELGEPFPFTLTAFAAGGAGARPAKDGLNTTSFPTGVRAAPTEVLETLTSLVQVQRELRQDSGGAGEFRGGLGQILRVRRLGVNAWSVNANIDRLTHPAPGARGGAEGTRGEFVDDATGRPLPAKRLVRLAPGTTVRLSFPGGGGYGNPADRAPEKVLDDVVNGYVGIDAARAVYGVDIEYTGDPAALVRMPGSYVVRGTSRGPATGP